MTLDAKQSIMAWVSVSVIALLFVISLKLNLGLPQWLVEVEQGVLLFGLLFKVGSWLWHRRAERSELNG